MSESCEPMGCRSGLWQRRDACLRRQRLRRSLRGADAGRLYGPVARWRGAAEGRAPPEAPRTAAPVAMGPLCLCVCGGSAGIRGGRRASRTTARRRGPRWQMAMVIPHSCPPHARTLFFLIKPCHARDHVDSLLGPRCCFRARARIRSGGLRRGHICFRCAQAAVCSSPRLTGNILVSRLQGAPWASPGFHR